MEIIKFERIVSVTSEIQGHSAQNLLEGEISPQKNWMCEKGTDKAIVILQLQRAAILLSIHIGNAHSAFVEVLVGKAADSTDQFESLIPMSSFMNPHESKTGTNPNRTRFFNKCDFNVETASKSWDRIKVVCTQPFNKHVPYGLCFLKVHGEKEHKKLEAIVPGVKKAEEEEDDIKIGSFFKKKRDSGGSQPLSVSEQIKEAEKESSLGKHTPISIANITAKMSEKQTEEKKPKKEASPKETGEKRKKVEQKPVIPKKQKMDVVPKTDEKKLSEGEQKKQKKEAKKKKRRRTKPFEKLMEDVVLVISGFKNPLRGNIRSMALEMGARYSGDWESHCTHLVCAYTNTPKFHQVKGKGKIVTKKWVEKCHADKIRYPWRRFALDKEDLKKPESEEEVEAAEDDSEPEIEQDVEAPSVSKQKASKFESDRDDDGEGSSVVKMPASEDPIEYDMPTDEDEDEKDKEREDTTDYPMPYLPDIFSSKRFFIDENLKNKSSIERYITAYNGVLSEVFDENIEFYITDKGGAELEVFREKAPNMIAVKPSWILEVNSKQKWIPTTSHLVH